MAAIAYFEPAIFMAGTDTEPEVIPTTMAGGQTVVRGDVATIAAGVASKAATNVNAALFGVASFGSVDVFFTGIGGAAAVTDVSLFGASIAGTAAQPPDPLQVEFYPFHNFNQFEMSVVQAWNANLLGTTFGFLLDAPSTKFVADNSQGNKPLTCVGKSDGPNRGVAGDTGARALFYVSNQAALGI